MTHSFLEMFSVWQQVQWTSPLWLLLLVFLPLVWLRRRREVSLDHTQVELHNNLGRGSWLSRMATFALLTAFVAGPVALTQPVLPFTQDHKKPLVRDIVLALDKSGSMSGADVQGELAAFLPPGVAGCNYKNGPTSGQLNRLDAACNAILGFVLRRPQDRIGLILFDDQAYWRLPLFLAPDVVADEARLLNEKNGGGTNFQGPTEQDRRMGPIQAAINHLVRYGQSKSKIVIMVTDGEDSIQEARMNALAQQLTQHGIRLYTLGVGSGWTGDRELDLRKLTEMAGGKVFRISDAGSMQAAFEEINRLEASQIVLEQSVGYTQLYPVFTALFFICLALYTFICVFFTREKP